VREPKPPSERDWKRAPVLEPRAAPRLPALVSDGAGLPFPPAALTADPVALDAADPAVAALMSLLSGRSIPIAGWRELARTADEALFGRGRPPQLVTVATKRDTRRDTWTCLAASTAGELRATRDGIRASSWRPDPTHEPQPGDTELRILVTERTFASGQSASRRVLEPDLYIDENELVLTIYIKPRPGFQMGARNPETPVRIALAESLLTRALIDGAVAEQLA
jgi:hypothetical protein